MARIVVQTDERDQILMDEEVRPVHMGDEHSSLQIIERLAWAVHAAEEIDGGTPAGGTHVLALA